MEAEILALAKEFLPGKTAENASAVLEKLCAAALELFRRQLRVKEEECRDTLVTASAMYAAGEALLLGQAESYSACRVGAVSLSGGRDAAAAGKALQERARMLMGARITDDGFCFRGVRP